MEMAIDMDRQPIPDPDFDFDIDVDVAIEIDDVRDQDVMLDGLETEAVDTRDEPMHEAEESPHLMEVDDHYAEGGSARRLPPPDGFRAAEGGASLDLEGDVNFTEETNLAEDLTLPDNTDYIREAGDAGTGVDDSTANTISAEDTLVPQDLPVDESRTLAGTGDLAGIAGHSAGLNVSDGLGHLEVLEDYSESTYVVGRVEAQEIDVHTIAADAKQRITDSGSAESQTPRVGTRDQSVSSHAALPSPEASQAKDQKSTVDQPNAETKDDLLHAEEDEDFLDSDYAPNPPTFQPRLHPVTVYHAGNERYLFRQGVNDSTENYLLTDESLAFASLSDLFAALRSVLGDSISEVDTLQFFVEKMDVDIFEDSISAQSWTLASIIDLHLQLCDNDGIVDAIPLYVELIVERGFQRKIRYIQEAVGKGLGYSRLEFRREVADAKQDGKPSGDHEWTTAEPSLTKERADGQSTTEEPSDVSGSLVNMAADESPAINADVSDEKATVEGKQPSPPQQVHRDPEKDLIQSGKGGLETSPNSYSTAPELDGKSVTDWSRTSDHPQTGARPEQPSLSHHSEERPNSAAERISAISTPHSRVRDEADDPDLIDYEDDEFDQTEYVDKAADPEQPQATDTTTSPQPEISGGSTQSVNAGRSYAQPDSPGITYSEDEDEVDTGDQFNDRVGGPPGIAHYEDKDEVGTGDRSSHRAGDSPGITYSEDEDEDEAGSGDRSNDLAGNPPGITYSADKDEINAGDQSNHRAGESPGITYSEDEDDIDAVDQSNDHAGDPPGITYPKNKDEVNAGDQSIHHAGDSPGITYSEDEYEVDAGDQSNVRAGDSPYLDVKEDEMGGLGSDQEPGAHGQFGGNDANVAVAARGGASGTIASGTDLGVNLSGDLDSKTAYDIEVEELEVGYTETPNENAVGYDNWEDDEADPDPGTAQPPQPSTTEGKFDAERFELDLDVFDEDLTTNNVKTDTSVEAKTAERAQRYRGSRSISFPEKIASVVADLPPQQANRTLNGEGANVVQSPVSATGRDIEPYDLPKRGLSMSAATGLPSKRDHAASVEPVAPGASDQEAKRVRHS